MYINPDNTINIKPIAPLSVFMSAKAKIRPKMKPGTKNNIPTKSPPNPHNNANRDTINIMVPAINADLTKFSNEIGYW